MRLCLPLRFVIIHYATLAAVLCHFTMLCRTRADEAVAYLRCRYATLRC